MTRTFHTVRDVYGISSNPWRVTVDQIATELKIGREQARELWHQALRMFTPTAQEQDLMREYRFSLAEARAALVLIHSGELNCAP